MSDAQIGAGDGVTVVPGLGVEAYRSEAVLAELHEINGPYTGDQLGSVARWRDAPSKRSTWRDASPR